MKAKVCATSSVQLPDNLLRFHRCPYCRRGFGDIHVDPEAAVSWAAITSRQATIAIRSVKPRTSLSCSSGPESFGASPCSHLLYLLVDINEKSSSKHLDTTTFTWVHPWFDTHDANGLAKDLLFADVFECGGRWR